MTDAIVARCWQGACAAPSTDRPTPSAGVGATAAATGHRHPVRPDRRGCPQAADRLVLPRPPLQHPSGRRRPDRTGRQADRSEGRRYLSLETLKQCSRCFWGQRPRHP